VFLEEENLALRKRMEFLEKQNQELILGLPSEQQQQQIQYFDVNDFHEPEEDLSISTCSSPLSSNFDFSTTPEHFLELPSSPDDDKTSLEITSTITPITTTTSLQDSQNISQILNTEEIDNEKQKEEDEMTIARNLIGKPAALTNYISLQLEELLAIFFLLNFMDSTFTSQIVSLPQTLNYLIHRPLKNFPLTMSLSLLKDIQNRYFEEKSRKKKFFSLLSSCLT